MEKRRGLNPVRLRLEIFTSRSGFCGYDPNALPLACGPEAPFAFLHASNGLVFRQLPRRAVRVHTSHISNTLMGTRIVTFHVLDLKKFGHGSILVCRPPLFLTAIWAAQRQRRAPVRKKTIRSDCFTVIPGPSVPLNPPASTNWRSATASVRFGQQSGSYALSRPNSLRRLNLGRNG